MSAVGRMNGKPDSIWEPDTILPAQFYAGRGSRQLDPERRLMLAVLEDAILVYQRRADWRDHRARRQREDAQQWLWSDDRTWLFSCANICDLVGLDVDYLRRGLLARQEEIALPRRDADRRVGIAEADVSGRKGGPAPSPLYATYVPRRSASEPEPT